MMVALNLLKIYFRDLCDDCSDHIQLKISLHESVEVNTLCNIR